MALDLNAPRRDQTAMRLLNIFAALSGLVALVMLVLAAHALRDTLTPENLERIKLAAFLQLAAAASALAIANRTGLLNLIAGALILTGAALFATTLYTLAIIGPHGFTFFAPIGGISLIAGWVTLIFTKPR
jgi:uncharacterized membrane protein YgdD (TMEM256/DUF423 family)